MKKRCDHFWEICFPITNFNKPKFQCIHCGKTKRDSIPILNLPAECSSAEVKNQKVDITGCSSKECRCFEDCCSIPNPDYPPCAKNAIKSGKSEVKHIIDQISAWIRRWDIAKKDRKGLIKFPDIDELRKLTSTNSSAG